MDCEIFGRSWCFGFGRGLLVEPCDFGLNDRDRVPSTFFRKVLFRFLFRRLLSSKTGDFFRSTGESGQSDNAFYSNFIEKPIRRTRRRDGREAMTRRSSWILDLQISDRIVSPFPIRAWVTINDEAVWRLKTALGVAEMQFIKRSNAKYGQGRSNRSVGGWCLRF